MIKKNYYKAGWPPQFFLGVIMNELGLGKRAFKQNEEVQEIYDEEINVSDIVGRLDILIQFWTPETRPGQKIQGRQMGKAIRWHPRKQTLEVKSLVTERVYEIPKKSCICAYRTEMPSKSRLPPKTIVKIGKDGERKRVPDPLYRLKVMEMTKKDRDKIKVVWK